MAVNKVDVNGVTVLDLTQDSVTPATLKKGETAHDASGAAIVGEMESSAPSLQSKSVTYTSNGTATITPDAPYDALSSVDVTVDVSGGGSGGEISIEVMNDSMASVTARGPVGGSKEIKWGGSAYFDKLSNGSIINIEKATFDSPAFFFIDNGYIFSGEFPNEEYSTEIMNAAEEFMNTMVREICDSYGFTSPDTIEICFDESSGKPAIIIM